MALTEIRARMKPCLLLTALQLLPCRGALLPSAQRGDPDTIFPSLEKHGPISATTVKRHPPLEIPSYPEVDIFTTETYISEVTVTVVTSTVLTGTVQILPTPTVDPDTTGQIYTQLETSGQGHGNPLLTSCIASPTSLISATTNATMAIKDSTNSMAGVSSNIFEPVATSAPPSQISQRSDHPVPRLGIQQTAPISTNKFFQNFLLGSQSSTTFLHPYSIAWAKGQGASQSWGMSVSHVDANQLALGPVNTTGSVSYFINPLGIQSLVLSAAELGASTNLTSTNITDMSALIQLRPSAYAAPAIEFPLTQGAGFVTGVYNNVTPQIETGVFFSNVTKVNTQPRPGVTKYQIALSDGKTWFLYATSTDGSSLDLQVVNNSLMRANTTFSGTIQVAKDHAGFGEPLYDVACGSYVTGVTVSGTAAGTVGTYTFTFQKAGLAGTPLMFALPHHVQSFDSATSASMNVTLQLRTTTKGFATAVVADSWTMVEPELPASMTFLPWSPTQGNMGTLSAAAKAEILTVAQSELSQNMSTQTNLNSMYYSGKALAKFALILAVVNDMLGETALAAAGLQELKTAFAVFTNNTQMFPLVYDSAWGGVVSSASYTTGDSGVDFGNTYYNDHHFHYGYHVLAAAVIAHLDPTWLSESQNQAWVNALLRDYANPSSADAYFPVSRMFDWYHGHSFAHGLYESGDGRDQESSSEDVMAAYALKMWGAATGDANTAARGDLMLAVQARALSMYYLYESNNTVEPADFIGNKVAGILFENKIDHTTYFGANIEYVQGIHMMPLLPSTALVRTQDFVTQEWAKYFSNGRADTVAGGWRGVLYGNLATVQPAQAWAWFSQSGFDSTWLDGGASLTWYMAYSAALAGL